MASAFSPVIKKGVVEGEPTLNFSQAIAKVLDGKKIHKLEWKDKGFYGFLNGERLQLHKPDGKDYDWIISQGDLGGDDWIIL